jgi:4-diphosphocytidyl-2-C-methyl-D-erythritol kinase
VPEIGQVIDHLNAQPGCLMARMSGSGGTCFGLFEAERAARDAADVLAEQLGWWSVAAAVRTGVS